MRAICCKFWSAASFAEVGARIAGETGLRFAEIKAGDRLTGTCRRTLTLNSGRFALIERAQEFSLVPWRPVLERAKGQSVTGEKISWSIGQKRGLGLSVSGRQFYLSI